LIHETYYLNEIFENQLLLKDVNQYSEILFIS